MLRTPRRASWSAVIVPENPPPTIATGTGPVSSDLIIGPVGAAVLALLHIVVEPHHGPPGGLGEDARDHRVDQAGGVRADHLAADLDRADGMVRPAHAQRLGMIGEQPAQ